jgi:hypothetical protein
VTQGSPLVSPGAAGIDCPPLCAPCCDRLLGLESELSVAHIPAMTLAVGKSDMGRIIAIVVGAGRWRNLTMRLTFLTPLCMIMLYNGFPGAARAQEYPWCADTGDGRVDCSFSSYEQCKATASGIGGCFQNSRPSLSDRATRSPSSTRRPRSR